MSFFIKKNEPNLLSNLSFPEKLIIWAAREWLQQIRQAKDPRKSLIKSFSQFLIQEAVYHFDKYMRITACCSINSIDIRSHCCLNVGDGENDMLASLSFSQNNFKNLNQIVLESILEDKSINNAVKCIEEIAISFARAGFFFPIRKIYFIKAKSNPEDFKNVIFNQFNKNDFMKYY